MHGQLYYYTIMVRFRTNKESFLNKISWDATRKLVQNKNGGT